MCVSVAAAEYHRQGFLARTINVKPPLLAESCDCKLKCAWRGARGEYRAQTHLGDDGRSIAAVGNAKRQLIRLRYLIPCACELGCHTCAKSPDQ